MSKEYVVSGHSGTTNETFVIPDYISLVFYADLNETCYVPNNEYALNLAIGSMRRFKFDNAGETLNDYEKEGELVFERFPVCLVSQVTWFFLVPFKNIADVLI